MLLSLISQFVARSVFISYLGDTYNGVTGLFSGILNILNIAELGFAYSVAFVLYKPLKEGNEEDIAAVMNFFSKVYRIIAAVVLVAGAALIPALQFLIADDINGLPFDINQLRIYYSFFLADTVMSYLIAYKRTIITADQNTFIISAVDNFGKVALQVVQIVLLVTLRSYYAFLITMVAKTLIGNIIISAIANKKYPYLKKYRRARLEKARRSEIFKNVEASFCHRLGNVIATGTSSVIISTFIGLNASSHYANYAMIITGVNTVINIIFDAVTASVGNLCVSGTPDEQVKVFKRIDYVARYLGVMCFTCFVCMFNSFISLWVGGDKVFPLPVVVVISVTSAIKTLRKPVMTFKDAQGLFKKDWYKPLVEAGVGIGLAIGLGVLFRNLYGPDWGTFGILFGYIVATLFIAVPIENVVLFKYGFKRSSARHNLMFAATLVFLAVICSASYVVCSFMPAGFTGFILRAVFSLGFSTLAFVLATFYTPEFKYYISLFLGIARRAVAKIKRLFKRGGKAPAPQTADGAQTLPAEEENGQSATEAAPAADAEAEEGEPSADGSAETDANGVAECEKE